MTRKHVVAAVVLLGLAALAASLWQRRDRSLEVVRQAGVLRVGYAVEAPHAFLNASGEVTGLSPELARVIARRMSVERIQWRLAEFGALLAELEEGRVDLVAAGMFITPARARRVAFSEPVFRVRQALLVARGNPLGLHSYQDVQKSQRARVAVLSGSVEQAMLIALGLGERRLVLTPDAQSGVAAVQSGKADGLALSSPTLAWMVANGEAEGMELARPFVQPPTVASGLSGYGAFALRKRDAELLRAWNAAQAEVLAGPEYERLMSAFGFQPEERPGNVTAREVAGQ